jgi:two-component system, OmpR family, sensor histidine kinase KdpD
MAESRPTLRLFLGYAPGVGKTCALLESGRRLREAGVDVVVGFVDTRGRPRVAELLEGLEILGPGSVSNAGPARAGLDIDAARTRRPRVLLLDRIERGNPPGSRHARSWQDIPELLDAGITVHATLDVFRLESLNDAVRRISGLRIEETVPDSVLERAGEIVLVDMPTQDLASRPAAGTAAADLPLLEPGALLALRALALRRAAECVDADIRAFRREHRAGGMWPTTEMVMACVGPSPSSARVVRAAARAADELHAPWTAVYVSAPDAVPMRDADRERLQAHLRLSESLGADVVRLTGSMVSEELLRFARERTVTHLVLGRPARSRLRDLLRGSLVDALVSQGTGIEIHVVAGEKEPPHPGRAARPILRAKPVGFAVAVALVAAITVGATFVRAFVPDTEIVMSYLLVIMVAAATYGLGPALVAAGLSVVAYDVFFIPPLLRLTVADARHLFTFAMMFIVGIAISGLTGRLRRQGVDARLRERRTASLYALVRELAASTTDDDAAGIASRHAAQAIAGEAVVLLRDGDGTLRVAGESEPGVGLTPAESAVARCAADTGRPAGMGTETHAEAVVVCLPIAAGQAVRGVLALRPKARAASDVEERGFLEALARQIALTIERIHLAGDARTAALRVRAEETRTSLLSAVSHDLRTPLAAITGAGSALRMEGGRLDRDRRRELIDTICDEAGRMDRLIGNILDMVRLEAGSTAARREWVPVEEIVGPALARMEDVLAARDVRVDLPDDLPLILVDPVLFEHLLFNLVDNAVKHTPPGVPIDLRAGVARGWIEIEVADRGPGLPPGGEEKVFEKFYRGPSPRGPGMGLGLAISRSIAQIHDGTLRAENRTGGGASFTVRLPIVAPPGDDALSRGSPPGGGQNA